MSAQAPRSLASAAWPLGLALLVAGLAAAPALAQVPGDVDGDSVADTLDNCPFTANLGQADASGDGIGDACQCGDNTADGFADLRDVVVLRRDLAALGPGVSSAATCSVAGGPLDCDQPDIDTLRQNLAGLGGPLPQLCQAALSTAPLGLTIFPGDGVAALQWSEFPAATIQGYLVYRALASGGPYTQLTPGPIADPSYHDSTLANGTTYFFVVSSVSAAGPESGFSPEGSVMPMTTGPTTVGGNISVDTIWTLKGSPYVATSSVDVRDDATLTIEPGVLVRFGSGMRLQAGVGSSAGAIVALGTAASRIVFTSDTPSPTAGHWRGVRVNSSAFSTNRFEHLTIEGSGALGMAALFSGGPAFSALDLSIASRAGEGLELQSTSGVTIRELSIEAGPEVAVSISAGDPVIQDATIAANVSDHGVVVTGTSAASLTASTIENGMRIATASPDLVLSGNTFPAYDSGPPAELHAAHVGRFFGQNAVLGTTPGVSQVDVIGGDVDSDSTWPGLVYEILSGVIDVEGDATPHLVIEAGATLRFTTSGGLRSGLLKPARLTLAGTASQPILLTSASGAPSAGDWRGVEVGQFTETGASLAHTTIEYAGQLLSVSLRINSSDPTVSNCVVRNGFGDGITLFGTGLRPRILDSRVESHTAAGILVTSVSPQILRNVVTGNAIGIELQNVEPLLELRNNDLAGNTLGMDNNDGGDAVDARLNWWGTAGDPSASLQGLVSYNPWLGAAFDPALATDAAAVHPEVFAQTQSSSAFSAAFAAAADWSLQIEDGVPAVVRSFAGSGSELAIDWTGDDGGGTPLPDGDYRFTLSSSVAGGGASGAPVIGNVSLDGALLVARIDDPTHLEVVAGSDVPILGSVGGAALASYTVARAEGGSTNFAQFANGSSPVAGGLLGTLSTAGLDAGVYTVRLLATGSGGESGQDLVTFQILAVDASAGTPIFSPNGDDQLDSAAINTRATIDADWVLRLRDAGSQVVRSFTGSGVNAAVTWDGLDDGAGGLADGSYSYELEATHAASGVMASQTLGSTLIDNTPPVATFDTPAAGFMHLLYDAVPVTGTVDDPNFGTYQLQYALESAPGSFLPITFSAAPVIAGPLGSLPVGDPNALNLGNGEVTLRLTVLDDAQNQTIAERVIELDRLEITNASWTPVEIDPFSAATSTLNWDLSHDASVSVRLYPSGARSGPAFLELVTSEARLAGSHAEVWDGLDGGSQPAPETGYYASIEASDGAGRAVLFSDPADPKILSQPLNTASNRKANGLTNMSGLDYSAFENDELVVTYDMTYSGRHSLEIRSDASTFLATIRPERGVAPGSHVAYWDGRDAAGVPYAGPFEVHWNPAISTVEDPSVFLRYPEFHLMDVRSHPYLFHPIHAQVTHVEYTLPGAATVEIDVIDPNGSFLRTLQPPTAQTAGTYTVDWTGTTDLDEIVTLEGSYTLEIRATETGTGLSDTRRVSALVFR